MMKGEMYDGQTEHSSNSTPGTRRYYGVNALEQRYTLLDLFAGAGGLSLGLAWAGFRSIGAVEWDLDAANTYDANFGAHVVRDTDGRTIPIEEINFRDYSGSVDLLAGGPPCQGFSQLGKGLASDPRNRLWHEFMRAVEEVRPRAFLMENVPPILKSEEGQATIITAKRLGYSVAYGVLKAERFGVPQKRRRAFIMGVRDGIAALPIWHDGANIRTVRWAIGDLPPIPDGRNWHIGRNPTDVSLQRYSVIPEGGNRFDLQRQRPDITPRCWLEKKSGSTDVFGRLWWDQPALTIRTEFFKPEKGRYLHPSEDRPITHREAARLQTFPDDFQFKGRKLTVARQIGNAVPPTLAFHLGMALRDSLEGRPHEAQVRILDLSASTDPLDARS